jgi:hypothetical protein
MPAESRRNARQAWTERLQRFPDSGLSVTAFCNLEGVSVQSFYHHKSKLRSGPPSPADDSPRLLPVRLLDQGQVPVEVALPCGAVLRLAPGCDLAFVRSLVSALGDPPC